MVLLIHLTHWAILFFVLSGWLWPWTAALWVHAVFIPLMILHWRTNRNRCFLSQLEEKFKDPRQAVEVEESHFMKSVWLRLTGKVPSHRALELTNHIIAWIAWSLTVVRLILRWP